MQGEGFLAPASQHLPAPTSLAGEKLVSECNATEDSVCIRCESGHYQQSWTKERHCTPHDICEDCKCSVLTLAPACGAVGLVSARAHLSGASPCPFAQTLASL